MKFCLIVRNSSICTLKYVIVNLTNKVYNFGLVAQWMRARGYEPRLSGVQVPSCPIH